MASLAMIWLAGEGTASANPGQISVLLFFIALPVTNALLDWPSWWVSRGLGRHLLNSFEKDRPRRRRFRVIAGHAAIDFVAAVSLLYLLAVALPFVIELFNLWCQANGLDRPLALRPFLTRAVANPWPDGLWVLAMLLSTLFPTFLHAMALIASPVMIWLAPDRRRRRIAAGLLHNDPDPSAIRQASWHLVWTYAIGITAPLVMLAGFALAIDALGRPVGDILLGAALRGMAGAYHLALWLDWLSAA